MEKRIKTTVNSPKKTIIVTGPESTGKTTVASYLAKYYNARLYPEFAREYVEKLETKYSYSDIENIAKEQISTFNGFLLDDTDFAIFDTYLIITKVWFLWYAKKSPLWIDKKIAETKESLYLLCAPDIDWVPDRVREHGGIERIKLFEDYIIELEKFNLDYRIINGLGETRNINAVKQVDDYIKRLTK